MARLVQLHGLELSNMIPLENFIDPSGGDPKLEEYSLPGWKYADVQEVGRASRKYSFQVNSFTRADIEAIIRECSDVSTVFEFYPGEDDRCVYAQKAFAAATQPSIFAAGFRYKANVEVTAQDTRQYGAEQGIPYARNVDLPQTVQLTNNGLVENTIDYLMISGDYNIQYTKDLLLSVNGTDFDLCAQLMRDDRFVLDRFGGVEHSRFTDFRKTYAQEQADVWGSEFFDYNGGTIGYQDLFLNSDAHYLMPFSGPLPVAATPPELDFTVLTKSGVPEVSVAFEPDLSDLEAIDYDIITGRNIAKIPNAQGKAFIAIGLTTDTDSQITLSSIKATVPRYVAQSRMPLVQPGENMVLEVADGEESCHSARAFHLVYRDAF